MSDHPRLMVFNFAAATLLAANAHAQSLTFSSKDPSKPIEVTAEKGVEWQQNDKRFIARGNAKAAQGDVSVTADELTAHYRPKGDGGTEIYRVDAVGGVTIKSSTETATGTAAVYDFDKAVLVLQGGPAKLSTPDGTVTAQNAIQYWANERVALAEGDATAEGDQRRIQADKLTAFFKGAEPASDVGKGLLPTNLKRNDITYLQANGNVRLSTAKGLARGDRGDYNLESGIATLDGSVKVTQGESQLSGGFAVVNTKTGITRLYGSAAEAGMKGPRENARVKALIAPSPKTTLQPTAAQPAAATSVPPKP